MAGKTLFGLAIYLFAASFVSSPAQAQLSKINVGYSAISGDALPAWVAKDAGIFEKNGLDVQLVFFPVVQRQSWRWCRPTLQSLDWRVRLS